MPRDNPQDWDDLTLARRCAGREEAAWREFLRRTAPAAEAVFRRVFARAGLPDPAREAEEAMGDLVHALLRSNAASLKAYRPPHALKTYVRVIARNIAVGILRKRHQTLSLDAGGMPLRELLEAPEEPGLPASPARLEEALARLPPREALALRLAYWDGHSLIEISRVLRIPMGTLGPLMSRAREALRRDLGKA